MTVWPTAAPRGVSILTVAVLCSVPVVLPAVLLPQEPPAEEAAPEGGVAVSQPSFPRANIDDPEAAAAYAQGIEYLEARDYDAAKSAFAKLRRSLRGDARSAAETCHREAKGGIEADAISLQVGKGKYRKALKDAVPALAKYAGLVIAEDLRALIAECNEKLFTVIEDFEERSNSFSEPDGGERERRWGRSTGGLTGFGSGTKIVEQDPEATTSKKLRTAPVREGKKALQWNTGDELSLVTFAEVEVDPSVERYFNIALRCESPKNAPQLHVIFDVDNTPVARRDWGDPRRQPGALLRARPGFHVTIDPKVVWQDLRIDLRKFKRKGKDVEWSDVSTLRIAHMKGAEGRIFLDSIRLERRDGVTSSTTVEKRRSPKHPLIAALDDENTEVLAKSTPGKIVNTLQRWLPAARIKPGTRKEKLTGGDGRKTNVWLHVPSRPAKSYGLIIVLHDYMRNGRDLLVDPYGKFAEQYGYLIVGPDAKKPLAGKTNPDLPPQILGSPTQHWWTYRSDGFVTTIIEEFAQRYPIDRDRVVLSGRGMGGWGTWNLGIRFPDRFSAIVPFAGGLSMGDYQSETLGSSYAALLDNLKWLPSYNAHNEDNEYVPVRFSRLLDAALKERKYSHRYQEIPAGERFDLKGAGPIMPAVTRWLASLERVRHPAEVLHVMIDEQHSRQHWLRIDARTDENAAAKIHGRIVADDRVEIDSENVADFTVFIADERIDEEGPITVIHNGETVHQGELQPSIEALIESWKGRRDPGLLYTRQVRLSGSDGKSTGSTGQ